jgi:hypothetical protein
MVRLTFGENSFQGELCSYRIWKPVVTSEGENAETQGLVELGENPKINNYCMLLPWSSGTTDEEMASGGKFYTLIESEWKTLDSGTSDMVMPKYCV